MLAVYCAQRLAWLRSRLLLIVRSLEGFSAIRKPAFTDCSSSKISLRVRLRLPIALGVTERQLHPSSPLSRCTLVTDIGGVVQSFPHAASQIGSASSREGVCQFV